MGNKKTSKGQPQTFLMDANNYKLVIIGLIVIAMGFILMSGGGSDDPFYFNESIYNFRRIRLAPTLVLIGFGIEFYAILFRSKTSK